MDSPQRHRLFFAIFLDGDAAAATVELARQLKLQHQLRGRVQPPERLHVTLHWLRDHDVLPPDLLRAAQSAGRCTADGTGPFDVLFDRAESLGDAGQPGKRPLVLAGGKGLAALRAFQRILGGSMSDAGIGRYARSAFKPHVTLLRDESFVPMHPVRPVRWRVRELVLIDSWQGLTRYDVLGRWPLTGRPPGLGDW
jgi:2'-5' RNA ligase